ncbi:hypothetical protein EMPS_10687 [Entomortierella parvispora]|uniref:Uncharacterized protein n=1 Tax=Entomortierella parvispora TaxID=205924 RepID=A0A9P3HFP4_9FUNG|nr:hypothetical protein EMPS_08165 [Entomortierella parvispora]GJJ78328.1 hypothetical protein EMPS_10687 [Entomortierella parvispora]
MPKASSCSFQVCGQGLVQEDRENFTPDDEFHWKTHHVDEPFTFTCGHSRNQVTFHRDRKIGLFTCICRRARILSTGSVKRHYDSCITVKEQFRMMNATGTVPSTTGASAASPSGVGTSTAGPSRAGFSGAGPSNIRASGLHHQKKKSEAGPSEAKRREERPPAFVPNPTLNESVISSEPVISLQPLTSSESSATRELSAPIPDIVNMPVFVEAVYTFMDEVRTWRHEVNDGQRLLSFQLARLGGPTVRQPFNSLATNAPTRLQGHRRVNPERSEEEPRE